MTEADKEKLLEYAERLTELRDNPPEVESVDAEECLARAQDDMDGALRRLRTLGARR